MLKEEGKMLRIVYSMVVSDNQYVCMNVEVKMYIFVRKPLFVYDFVSLGGSVEYSTRGD